MLCLPLNWGRQEALFYKQLKPVPQFDYSPNEIKKAVSGLGHASENQVQFMVKQLFCLKEIPETDAV